MNKAKETFNKFIKDPLFGIELALYWAEGAKKNDRVSFMNSDPEMVKIIVDWYQKVLATKKEDMHLRLYIHKPYKDENCEEYWADKLDFLLSQFKKTVYKPTPHSVKKNPDYKGCLRLSISGIQNLRKVLAWQKLFIKYYNHS
ncbi:MAG: hypothetical protein WD552_00730 [Candidatus Paceibacterota bacterium]